MIVDLERNDLARVARTGSVRVDELFAVRRWCDLWQAESVVSRAGCADGRRAWPTCCAAVCPGGSVTGAPKLAALAEIAALEPVGRGASMGALGWIGPDRRRPGPDHPHGGRRRRPAAPVGRRRHHLGQRPDAEVAEAAAKAAPIRAALAAAAAG